VWNETGASLAILIQPYWYETWWFYGLCGIVVISIIFGAYYARVQQLQYRAVILKNTVAERTAELSTANKEIQTQLAIQAKQASEIELANKTLQESNERLHTLNLEKNELMGIVAHDLKNPIGAVRGLADLLQGGATGGDKNNKDDDGQLSSISGQIIGLADRMLAQVKNLLDANQLESGAMRFQAVQFDIAPLVESAVWQYRSAAEAKNITLYYALTNPSNLVFADEQAMMQVLDNLLSNAVKYSPHGKQVFVRVVGKVGAVRVEVQDEGVGISDDDMKKLFGKFTRLSARPTGGEHSTGLGLSIVKKMVEAMNGRVWCESELGKGATFIVELPGH
jgi:signal transduction histidine kinase